MANFCHSHLRAGALGDWPCSASLEMVECRAPDLADRALGHPWGTVLTA